MAKYLSNVIGNCNVLGAGGCVVVEMYDFCKALPLSLLMMWTAANDVIHMCNTLSRYQLTEYYVSSYVYTFFNKIKITPIFGWMDCIARRESLSAPSAVCGPALLCIFLFPTSCSSENDQSNNFIGNWNKTLYKHLILCKRNVYMCRIINKEHNCQRDNLARVAN